MTERRVVVMARHGESEWSKNNIFCGWYDSLLSDRGTYFSRSYNFNKDQRYTQGVAPH